MNSLLKFFTGLALLGFMLLWLKPVMDEFTNSTHGILATSTNATVFELAFWQNWMILMPLVVIAFLIYKYVRKED